MVHDSLKFWQGYSSFSCIHNGNLGTLVYCKQSSLYISAVYES